MIHAYIQSIVFFPLLSLIVAGISDYLSLKNIVRLAKLIMFFAIVVAIVGLAGVIGKHASSILLSIGIFQCLLDSVSITFFIMVSIIGWVVIDFSKNYLWGDP
ncbi:MAG: hypothetical protein N2203_05480, partial [Bacteroidia bacterium]|nr:hypothetical protein [Bacteroidia bacterium]